MSGKPRLKTPAQITAPSQLPMPETLMADLLTLENLFNLGVLIFLQAVLGFDNLLYISIESQRAPKEMQAKVRRDGILIAIGLRIVLLFAMMQLIAALQEPFVVLNLPGIIEGGVNFSTVVFILGGGFIMYTAVKEIKHLLELEDPEHAEQAKPKSVTSVIALIVLMNLIPSCRRWRSPMFSWFWRWRCWSRAWACCCWRTGSRTSSSATGNSR
jgi:predicted tellurium resistance membrane protein TerC